MMRLATRYADIRDADLAPDASDPAGLRPAVTALEHACREADHPLAGLRAMVRPATGSPEQLADLLHARAAEGFSRVQVWLSPATPAAVDALAEGLDILDRG